MPKLFKDKIEFYITNVCNFNCDNCNRLNNYYFSGHEIWQDYRSVYEDWSQRMEFGTISILGGEPTLNPTLDQWVIGLRELWPQANINIVTNGSNLRYWNQRGLFELLSRTRTGLWITLHNRARRDALIDEIKSYLRDPVVELIASDHTNWVDAYRQVKDGSWPECETYQDFESLPEWIQQECREVHQIGWEDWLQNTGRFKIHDRDDSNIQIMMAYSEDFVTAPLRYAGDNQFMVYDSDPVAAHDVCWSKYCTHMMHGKMYKCHHVALLPEFARQFQVNISSQDQALLESYRPLTASDSHEVMQDFIEHHVNQVIPQCKLCPSRLQKIFLESGKQKPKIKKIVPIREI